MHTSVSRKRTFNRAHHIKRARRAAKHPFAVPVFTIIFLVILTAILLLIFNRHPDATNPNVVVISHDKQQQVVSSKEPTVGALLEKLDLKINEGDVVEPALATAIQQDDFRINIYRAVPVEVVDGDQKQFAFSAATTPRSVARQAGLTVYPEDTVVTKPITDFVLSGGIGQEVVVTRAVPISVNLYGAPVTMRTHAKTVRGLLAEKKITLLPQDIVTPAIDTPITANAQLAVVRNGLTTSTVQEDIPTPMESIIDATLSYGSSAVRQQGSPGKRAVTYEINTQNGKEVSRKAIQTVIITQPVTQITVQGANLSGIKGDMARAGIAPADYEHADFIISHESGWCPTKWQGQIGFCPPTFTQLHPSDSGYGYGLGQATPGSKMAAFGADWQTNPVTQLKWADSYAKNRTFGSYGKGWAAAHQYWLANSHW